MQRKCVEIAGENEVDGALDSLAQVFEDWISSKLHIQHCQKSRSFVPASTKVIYVDD